MQGLFRRERFRSLGTCALDAPGTIRPTVRGQARRGHKLRELVRRDCPRLPGVYGMTDATGELIYVGKAKSLRARLLGYFRRNSRDDKAEQIIKEARGLLWEVAPSELSALLRELELIRRWQPRFNVQGQPRRQRRCYVCIGRRPAQYAYVVSKPASTAVACFGPVPGVRMARLAARRLNDWYRLRDCPQKQRMRFADQRELFPVLSAPGCLRHEIGHCLAPCAAQCTRGEYGFHVEAALDFLNGRDRTPLDQLERQRDEAAVRLEFERAAILRDRHRAMEWLFNHLERIREAVRHSFVYPVRNHDGSETWYLVRHGLVRAAVPAPHDEPTRRAMAARLEALYGGGGAGGVPGLEEIDGVLLVAGWFRRHKEEKARVLEVEQARARCTGGEAMSTTAEPIYFYSTTGEHGCFSNFYRAAITLDGQRWPTSEHYFQAQKFAGTAHEGEVRRARTPSEAARRGRDRKRPLRADWERVKDEVMRRAVRAKFTQHDDLRAILLATGDAVLIEHTANDAYWGDGGDGSGQNRLGQILMSVREELRGG